MILLVKKGRGVKKEIIEKSYLVVFLLSDRAVDFIKFFLSKYRDEYITVEAYCEDERGDEYILIGVNYDDIPVNIMELSKVLDVSPLKSSINRKILNFTLKEKNVTLRPRGQDNIFIDVNLCFLKFGENENGKYVFSVIPMDSVYENISVLLKFKHPLTKIALMTEALKKKTSMTNIVLEAVNPWI